MPIVISIVLSLFLLGVVTCQMKLNHPEIEEYLQQGYELCSKTEWKEKVRDAKQSGT